MKLVTSYSLLLLFIAACNVAPLKCPPPEVVVKEVGADPAPVPSADTSYLEFLFKKYDLINIHEVDSTIRVDLRYSDTSNFLHRDMYDGLKNAYFNCETAWKLAAAQFMLRAEHPSYSLLVLDATRPKHVQQLMWDSLDMHPDLKYNYLSPPYETSLHNYGCAADITIIDLSTDSVLDMGTEFDVFSKLSQPLYEQKLIATGELSLKAHENRKLLRKVMNSAGLQGINSEWWHFSICKREEAVRRFRLVE